VSFPTALSAAEETDKQVLILQSAHDAA